MFQKNLKLQFAILLALAFLAIASSRPAAAQTTPNPLSCSGYPEPRIFMETHAWLTGSSQVLGQDSAQVRFGTCFPYKQTVTGKVAFDIRVTMQNNAGTLKNVDGYVATKSGTTLVYSAPTTFTCAAPGTCEKWYHVVADTALVPYDGRQEFRIRADVTMPDGKRLVAISGWQAYLRNGKVATDYRTGDVSNALGSVDGVGTTVARLGVDAPTAPVSGVWNFKVSALQGYNGVPVTGHSVVIDPDYKNNTNKIELKVGSGSLSDYSLSLDTAALTDGVHRLAIRGDAEASGNTGSTLMDIPFVVKNGSVSPLAIVTSSLPGAITGSPYSTTLTATGGTAPYQWSVASGQLPAGISLTTDGRLLGTPTTAGSYNVQIAARDSAPTSTTANATFNLTVASASSPLAIPAQTLPSGTVGTSYSAILTATGGVAPYLWTVSSGTLPAGITLSSGGNLSGTPTASGTFSFGAKATDAAGTTATRTFSMGVAAATTPLTIPSQTVPGGTVGTSYSATLTATGGVAPYLWTVVSGALPAGITLSSNGTLSGTPTASGTFSFGAKATDAAGKTASQTFSLAVSAAPSSGGGSVGYMFITKAELNSKPTSGAGWTFMKSKADSSWTNLTLGDQNSYNQTYVLAAALIYARDPVTYASYRDKVITAIKKVPGTEANANQLLAVARTLFGYVVSADLVGMPQSTVCNNGETWLHFLQRIRTQTIPGNSSYPTLEITSGKYANNWGAHSLSSHLAVSYALGDSAGVTRDLNILKRWLGDTTSSIPAFTPDASYRYNSDGATWDMTPTMQRGINPYSATDSRQGMLIEDGMRLTSGGADSVKCCTVQPAGRGYMAESLDALIAAVQLFRAHGVDLRSSQDSALKRAFDFYKRNGGQEYSSEQVLPYAINYFYGSNNSKVTETTVERKIGYGSWLFTGPTP